MANLIEHCLSWRDGCVLGLLELGYKSMSLVLVLVHVYSGVLSHTLVPEVCKVCFGLQVCFGGH